MRTSSSCRCEAITTIFAAGCTTSNSLMIVAASLVTNNLSCELIIILFIPEYKSDVRQRRTQPLPCHASKNESFCLQKEDVETQSIYSIVIPERKIFDFQSNKQRINYEILCERLPFGPNEVRTIFAKSLQASMLLFTASSIPERCLEPSFSKSCARETSMEKKEKRKMVVYKGAKGTSNVSERWCVRVSNTDNEPTKK
jgi:hypothetical protein